MREGGGGTAIASKGGAKRWTWLSAGGRRRAAISLSFGCSFKLYGLEGVGLANFHRQTCHQEAIDESAENGLQPSRFCNSSFVQ